MRGANLVRCPPIFAALPALIHWEVKVGGTGMKDVRGAVFAGSSPPFLGRERAADDVIRVISLLSRVKGEVMTMFL